MQRNHPRQLREARCGRRSAGSLPAIATLAVLLGGGATDVRGAQADLAVVTDIECRFPLMTVGTWGDEGPEAEIREADLVLEFEAINADEATAQMASNFGNFDIIVRYADGYLHFIQSFLDGPLHSTTVLEETNPDGSWRAMHSRHEFTAFALPGFTSSPEQYYGSCVAAESADAE